MSVLRISRIERSTTVDQVVGSLRERILSGEFPPAMTLPEVSLAKSLGISRNTLREALRILQADGMVVRSAHRGAAVAGLSREDLRDIFAARTFLEMAGVQAAPNGDELEGLRECVRKLDAAVKKGDWHRIVELDMGFHCELVKFLKSPRLEQFFSKLVAELRLGLMALDRTMERPFSTVMDEHRKIVQLLEKNEKDKCEQVLRQHLERSEKMLQAAAMGPRR